MKRSIRTALVVASLAALSAPVFAQNAQVYYPSNSPAGDTVASQGQGKTRAQVKAELKAAEQDGSMARMNNSVFFGH